MLCMTDSFSSSSSSSTSSSVQPLTPSTHQKLSQAILDIFLSFGDVQRRLGIPRGNIIVIIIVIVVFVVVVVIIRLVICV